MRDEILALSPIVKVEETSIAPIYIWKTGRTIFPSRKERAVADVYVARLKEFMRTGKSMAGVYQDCVKALKAVGTERDEQTCKRWLNKSHVQDWLGEQFKAEAVKGFWTEETWLMVMTDHLSGKKRLANGDLYGMSLIAKVCKFDVPETVNFNQITITQSDGRA